MSLVIFWFCGSASGSPSEDLRVTPEYLATEFSRGTYVMRNHVAYLAPLFWRGYRRQCDHAQTSTQMTSTQSSAT